MDITLYSTNCPRCCVLKKKLDAKSIKYAECADVDEMLAKGIQQAPMLSVNGHIMDFGTAVKWVGQQEEIK